MKNLCLLFFLTVSLAFGQTHTEVTLEDNQTITGIKTFSYGGTFTNAQPNLYVVSQVGSTNFAGTGLPNETDAFTGITTCPVGATTHQCNGGSFICYSNAVSSPLGTTANCVGVFGVAQATVSNSAVWSANFGASALTGTSGNLVIGIEQDMGLPSGTAPARFQPIFVNGLALNGTMPPGPVMGTALDITHTAAVFGVAFNAGSAQFPVAYWSGRGTAPVGVMLDASCYSGACNSQITQYGGNDGTNAHTADVGADQNGKLIIAPDVAYRTFGSSTNLDGAACETNFAATTLNTGSTTTNTGQNCLPANAIIDAVVYRITTTITTAANFTIGDGTTAARFCGTQSTLTAGTTGICFAQADQTGAAGPRQTSAAAVRVTTNVNPGAGAIRLIVYYHTWTPATA